jgi:hypothetical protein
MSIESNPECPSFFARVLAQDALRKGFAAAIAGAIIATVSEAVWPSHR